MRHLLFACTAVAALLCTSPLVARDAVSWAPSYEAGRQMAAAQGKLLLLHFWTPSCGPCRGVDAQVFSQPRVGDALAQNFVCVKVNAEDQPELARRFSVRQWPTDVVVTPAGQNVYRTTSPQNPEAYLKEMSQAVAAARHVLPVQTQVAQTQILPPAMPPRDTAPANYNAPGQGNLGSGNLGPNNLSPGNLSGPAGGYSGQYDNLPPSHSLLPPPPGQNPPAAPGLPPGAMGYHAQLPTGAAQPPHFAPTLPAGGSWPPAQNAWNHLAQPPAGAAAAPVAGDPYATAPAAPPAPQMVFNPQTGPGMNPPTADHRLVAHNGLASNPNAAANAAAPPAQAGPPAIPAGNPPLGIEGYCPVTLIKERKWIRGDVKWGAIHRGRTYLFLAKEKQEEFLKSPDQFSPMLSGFDPVKYAEQGLLIPGRRQHGLFYGKKENPQVYLFADEDAVRRFESAPARYTPVVKQAMVQGSETVQR